MNGNNEKVKEISVDPEKVITKVSIGLSISDSIVGLRMYDSTDELIVNDNWWDQRGFNSNIEYCHDSFYEPDLKQWETRSIPEGQEIIGLRWH